MTRHHGLVGAALRRGLDQVCGEEGQVGSGGEGGFCCCARCGSGRRCRAWMMMESSMQVSVKAGASRCYSEAAEVMAAVRAAGLIEAWELASVGSTRCTDGRVQTKADEKKRMGNYLLYLERVAWDSLRAADCASPKPALERLDTRRLTTPCCLFIRNRPDIAVDKRKCLSLYSCAI